MTSRGIPFTPDEVERIADAARERGLGRAEFIRQCVVRVMTTGYYLSERDEHRLFEVARSLGTSKAEFCTTAIRHALDEVEAIARERGGRPYREPISPFRPRGGR